ncbi:MAG TPA: hypothetical protein VFO00_01050 [Vitreimonas sp.]|nr:hypothetical protein [Vitreimonas sp.]
MRSLMLAMCCGAALFLFAPEAKAQDGAPQEPAISDEAPVDIEAERLFCPRRMGGPSARRTARRCEATAVSYAPSFGGAGTCAVRHAYRGHRRINYRPRSCEPLFQRGPTSAI